MALITSYLMPLLAVLQLSSEQAARVKASFGRLEESLVEGREGSRDPRVRTARQAVLLNHGLSFSKTLPFLAVLQGVTAINRRTADNNAAVVRDFFELYAKVAVAVAAAAAAAAAVVVVVVVVVAVVVVVVVGVVGVGVGGTVGGGGGVFGGGHRVVRVVRVVVFVVVGGGGGGIT